MVPFPINLNLPWLIAFIIASCGLVATAAVWIYTEWGEPEWKRYQALEMNAMRENLQKQLSVLEDPQWGDPAKAKVVKESIEFLSRPDYQIKQTILKGYGIWLEGTTGTPVDRCMTCHIDEDKLDKQHPTTKEYFPFSTYGCTVCHDGEGRVLTKEGAHHGIYKNRKEMMERVKKPEEVMALWTKMAELSIQPGMTAFDFRDYSAAGEKLVYVGSISCIKCHKKLTQRHVETWTKNKFKTWDKVREAKDFNEGDEAYREKCEKCHTTGYDEKTAEYAEEGVTCEACHGPGEMFAKFMSEGKLAEAAVVTHDVFSYEVCGRCHTPRAHDMREAMLVASEEREFKGWLATSFNAESDALYAASSEKTDTHSLDESKRLEEVGNSLDIMLDDIRELLPEQEEAVQTAVEVELSDEAPPHPLKVELETPEPINVDSQKVQAGVPKTLFIGTYADAR